ncbi:hypothetical protein GW17_00001967 [Ensete ventricosum]|nr:hypothetical protein GW17_00001967 [Ensete ventricosum]
MDQEAALDLVKKGATLLLLDVPQFTLFGIDTQVSSSCSLFSFLSANSSSLTVVVLSLEGNEFSPTVGFFLTTLPAEVFIISRFALSSGKALYRVVRTGPPIDQYGTVRYRAVSPKSTVSGRFRSVLTKGGRKKKREKPGSPVRSIARWEERGDVVVRKWHHQEERLINVSEDEEDRYSEAVRRLEFDPHLGPYALDRHGEWKQLSNYITQNIIERIVPIGGDITIAYESGLIDKVSITVTERRLLEQLKDSKFSKSEAEGSHRRGCYYTSIPRAVKHKGISGEELTAMNLDKVIILAFAPSTKLLEAILMKDYGGEEDSLLGELQFAFVAFMMAQSLEAFLQWKSLTSLLLSCTEAPLRTRTQLFSKHLMQFIRVLYCQLKYGFHKKQNHGNDSGKGISLSLDDAWFSKDIFLFRLCKDFFPLVLESPVVDGDLLLWV